MSKRLSREKKTIEVMIAVYCQSNHQSSTEKCPECTVLYEYCLKRIDYCPFGERKPVCQKCTIHCYKPEQRTQIKNVMHYSGPKMLMHHPILALWHLLDSRRYRKGTSIDNRLNR